MNYFKNNPSVVAAIIIAIGAVTAVLIYQYYTPFEQCVRDRKAKDLPNPIGACMYLTNR